MFRFFLVLALTSVPFAAAADGHERLKAMKQFCEDDASVGFNWENGRYEQANFMEKKFTLTRIDPLNYGDNLSKDEKNLIRFNCFSSVALEEEYNFENFYNYNTCLKFSELGGGEPRYLSCQERHLKIGEEKSWKVSFSCERKLDFTPNEFFHHYFLHSKTSASPGSLGERKDYKDSLSLSVGRCSSILE